MIPSGFLSPEWLWLLLGVAALTAVYVAVQLRRKKFVARFSNVELLGSVAPRRPGWRRHLTFAFVLLALTSLTFGLARPSDQVDVPRERATVILAIDVSLSMKATDVVPSRIDVAKKAGKQFVDLLPTRINLGVLSFALSANVVTPPTLDRVAAKRSIDALTLQNYTAIGEAIFGSIEAIQNFAKSVTTKGEEAPPAAIVLLSDGSNTVGRPVDQAIAAAVQAKIPVSTIAFGTPNGTVESEGQTVQVPADTTTLNRIARETGGSFHTAASQEELTDVYSDIGSQVGYTKANREVSWRYNFLGVTLLLLGCASAMLWSGRLV